MPLMMRSPLCTVVVAAMRGESSGKVVMGSAVSVFSVAGMGGCAEEGLLSDDRSLDAFIGPLVQFNEFKKLKPGWCVATDGPRRETNSSVRRARRLPPVRRR